MIRTQQTAGHLQKILNCLTAKWLSLFLSYLQNDKAFASVAKLTDHHAW